MVLTPPIFQNNRNGLGWVWLPQSHPASFHTAPELTVSWFLGKFLNTIIGVRCTRKGATATSGSLGHFQECSPPGHQQIVWEVISIQSMLPLCWWHQVNCLDQLLGPIAMIQSWDIFDLDDWVFINIHQVISLPANFFKKIFLNLSYRNITRRYCSKELKASCHIRGVK